MRWLFIIFASILIIDDVLSQDTLYIDEYLESEWVGTYAYLYEDASLTEQISDILQKPNHVWERQSTPKIIKGVSTSNFWIRFVIKNTGTTPQEVVLVLENHSVERLKFFCYDQNQQIDSSILMGDMLPFPNREVEHRYFSYHLQIAPQENFEIYCMAGKLGGKALFPLKVYHPNYWLSQSNDHYLFHGLIFGLFIILIFISFFILILNKKLFSLFLFLEYLFIIINVGNTTGLGFQYVWSEFTIFRQIASPLTLSIALLCKTLFIIYYFNSKQHQLSHQLLKFNVLIYSIAIFLILSSAIITGHLSTYSQGGLMVGYLFYSLMIIGTLTMFTSLILLYFSTKRTSIFIYTIPNCIHILISLYAVTMYYLPITSFPFNRDLIIFGSYLFEGLVIILAIGLDYNSTKTTHKELELELYQKKAEALQNLLKGQETERKRLSRELHDGLSIRLAQLKNRLAHSNGHLQSTSLEVPKLIQEINNIHQDVRNFSHALNPTVLQDFGLQKALNDTIYSLEMTNEHLDIEFNYSLTLHLSKDQEKHFYHIIQELLHNTDKYAKASNIKIDIKQIDDSIELRYFDDGDSFDPKKKTKGLGLKNILSRVNLMKGSFVITSLHPKGKTQIIKVLH